MVFVIDNYKFLDVVRYEYDGRIFSDLKWFYYELFYTEKWHCIAKFFFL